MHGALRSLIISCVLGAVALAGAPSLRAQDSQIKELPAQVQPPPQNETAQPSGQAQERPDQTAREEANAQAQAQEPEHVATQSDAAPGQTAAQPVEPKQQQASHSAPEQSQGQPSEPKEQQRSRVAPEQTAKETPEPAKVDLSSYAPGTIVVETSERKLHLVLGNGEVLTYPVGVGKSGRSWAGSGAISGKYLQPAWSPPRAVRREKPWLPDYIPGGSPRNPMGAAAMTLSVDQYAIHGTNDDSSIGGFVSFGCIRMHNHDILDLYKRVRVGTRVVVLR